MRKKSIIFLFFLLAAIATRFLFLGLRPIHHDEGMLSYFAWQLSEGGGYIYTPQIHGPILFYLQALFFKLLGTGDNVVRASTALFGVILAVLPLAFYEKLGKKRAIFISFLIIISPLLTYFSRFLVHTALVVVPNFLVVMSLWLVAKTNRCSYLYLLAVSLAVAFGISETSYIFLASLVLFVPFYFLFNRKDFLSKYNKFKIFFIKNYLDFISAFLLFIFCWILIYSIGLTSLKSLILSLPNPFNSDSGLGFWLAQHDNRLGGQPWFYYLVLFLIYEPFVFVGGILAAFDSAKRRGGLLQLFSVFLSFMSLVGYSIAGEKFPWLFLPTLMLFTVTSGLYWGNNFKNSKIFVKLILILILLFTMFNNYRLNFVDPANTRELATYVQTPNSFKKVRDEVRKGCKNASSDCVVIDFDISWPLSWEFRDISKLDYFDNSEGIKDTTKYIFANPDKAQVFEGLNFVSDSILLRDWWVPSTCRQINCVDEYFKYFIFRDIWNSKGGYEIMFLQRQ